MIKDSGMARYALWRLLGLIPTLLIMITVAFFLMRVAPGGPFDSEMLLPPDIEANLNARYHMDEPLLQQYFRYLSQVAVLDFGFACAVFRRSYLSVLVDFLLSVIRLESSN